MAIADHLVQDFGSLSENSSDAQLLEWIERVAIHIQSPELMYVSQLVGERLETRGRMLYTMSVGMDGEELKAHYRAAHDL